MAASFVTLRELRLVLAIPSAASLTGKVCSAAYMWHLAYSRPCCPSLMGPITADPVPGAISSGSWYERNMA